MRTDERAVIWRPGRQLVLSLVKDIEIVGEAATQITEATRSGTDVQPLLRVEVLAQTRVRILDEPQDVLRIGVMVAVLAAQPPDDRQVGLR